MTQNETEVVDGEVIEPELTPQEIYESQRDALIAAFESDPKNRDKALAEIYIALKSFEAFLNSVQSNGGMTGMLKLLRGKVM